MEGTTGRLKGFFKSALSKLTRFRFRIGSIAGIPLSLHWSWLPCIILWALLDRGEYTHRVWKFAEVVGLFGIVLLHELGHAFAARRFKLQAREIILWPLGGFALLEPPRRWTKEFWIVAAGPLVNVVLIPVLFGIWIYFEHLGKGNFSELWVNLLTLNTVLLIFNLLPIWPLDGGRLLQSILTGAFGISRSTLMTSSFSFLCSAVGVGLAALVNDFLLVALLVMIMFASISMFNWARWMLRAERDSGLDRSAKCPECGSHPLDGAFQRCEFCAAGWNPFYGEGKCWHCGQIGREVKCLYCQAKSPLEKWRQPIPSANDARS